jgi:hypothetical protein
MWQQKYDPFFWDFCEIGLSDRRVVPKVGSTAPWGRWDYLQGTKKQGGRQGAPEVGPSERVVRLFTIEVTLDQTLGNWHHFITPIQHIINLLTVK